MKRLLLAAGLGIVMLARAPRADACCARPNVGFSPASGTILPPRPTIYVFIPREMSLLYEAQVFVGGVGTIAGRAGAIVELVAKSHAYEVVRVRVLDHQPGLELTVRWVSTLGETVGRASYRVGDPPPDRARVVGVTHEEGDETGLSTGSIRLELEGTAIAYRLTWDDGSTTILPADDAIMWTAIDENPRPPPTADLGHVGCVGYSVDLEELSHPRAFDLHALFADGSELRIGSSTAQLGGHGVRLPLELVNGAPDARGLEVATRLVAPPWWTGAVGALGGAVALAGAALLGRRRRRDHMPRPLAVAAARDR
jgi:hypothetical protein